MSSSYVAYTGSYTFHGNSKGIGIFDVDEEKGRLSLRKEIEVNNSSYLCTSPDQKMLYSLVDEGIASFRIEPDGDLTPVNVASIKGMRGCHVSVDPLGQFIFTAGYHDGKTTILRLNDDGSVGEITDEVYDRGFGSIAERNFRPHVSCVRMTPDNKYLLAADLGIDQIKVFSLDRHDGKLRMIDIIRCELESAPRSFGFSADGRHMYVVSELKNYITTFNYNGEGEHPIFEFKQLVSTLPRKCNTVNAAYAMKLAPDQSSLFCTNAGDNSVCFYERDQETGLLYMRSVLPISGEYPKDLMVFPDGKHLCCLNQDSNTITYFTIDYEKGVIVMDGLPTKLDNPNCGIFVKLNG